MRERPSPSPYRQEHKQTKTPHVRIHAVKAKKRQNEFSTLDGGSRKASLKSNI